MLKDQGVDYHYREYTREPLSATEIRTVLGKLGVGPKDVLRRRDRAFIDLGLSGNESDDELIAHMAEHPTLLQRPIGVLGDRAAVGRPPDRLLELL